MENDRKTILKDINIVFDGDLKYLEKLKKDADENDMNCEEDNSLSIRSDSHDVVPGEIYLDDGKLCINCEMISKEGKTFLSLDIPLSQEILFDILGDSIKKFNKIKTIFEATK